MAAQKNKPGVLRSPALITPISLLLLKTLISFGLSELESQRQEKVIFTVLQFSLPVSGNINKSVHLDNGSFQVWSITILIKGKEPSAVHELRCFKLLSKITFLQTADH